MSSDIGNNSTLQLHFQSLLTLSATKQEKILTGLRKKG